MPKKVLMSIGAGTASFLHHDAVMPIVASVQGKSLMTRASRIEPDPAYQKEHGLDTTPWYVDLTLSGGPEYTPGFMKREDAIAFEEEWLNVNVFLKDSAIPLTIPS